MCNRIAIYYDRQDRFVAWYESVCGEHYGWRYEARPYDFPDSLSPTDLIAPMEG